jgi:hypothetical protein
MISAAVFEDGRTIAPHLSYGADVLFALACAASIPGAAPWLPLVPLLVVLPHVAVTVLQAGARRGTIHWVPDPLAPDWSTLARLVALACRNATDDCQPQRLRLSPLCRKDGTPRPYTIDFDPGRRRLTIREQGETRQIVHHLDPVPRLKLPLPVVVRQTPVSLLFTGGEAQAPPGTPHPVRPSRPAQRLPHPAYAPATVLQIDTEAPVRSFLPGVMLAMLTLPFNRPLGAVAAVACLTPLAARALGGETTIRWHPWGRQPAVVTSTGVSRRFDMLRLWVGWLGILRAAAPAGPWLRSLQDPIGFLAWGCLIPLALSEGLGRFHAWRYRRTVRPS